MSCCRKSVWHGVGVRVADKRRSRRVKRCQLPMSGRVPLRAIYRNTGDRSASKESQDLGTCHTSTSMPDDRAPPLDFSTRLEPLDKIHLSLFHPLFHLK